MKGKRSYGGGGIKRKTNMFTEMAGMTSVILDLSRTETETPENVAKCDGVGMTQESMPEIDANGEGNRCGGGGGRRMHRIKLVGDVTSVEHHPGPSVFDTKTKTVKFNSNRIFTSRRFNRNKVLNKMRKHKYVRHRYRHVIRTKTEKCGTVADNDAAIGGDGSGSGKITRMSKHVSSGPGVHVPVTSSS